MGDGAADERVVPRLEPIVKHRRRQETASLPIPDELLAEILLLLPAADLARASAACVSFRRVAVDRSFRRLYRTRHPPPLLGFLAENEDGRNIFHPAVPPYPSAAADLSFSFLPAPAGDWVVQHVLDRRVLLDRRPEEHKSNRHELLFPETVVCDPLYRRYILLPPIPAHLAAMVDRPLWSTKQQRYCETFLAPPEEEAEETSFRVIWMAQCMTGLVAFVFSSNTGQWREVPPWRWSELSDGLPPSTAMAPFNSRRHVYGCFYWLTREREESELLVLDARAMEFSVVETPPEADICYDFAMVETGEGRPGMCVFVLGHGLTILSYFIRQNDVGSSTQWQKVKTIPLGCSDHLICSMEKHLLLQ